MKLTNVLLLMAAVISLTVTARPHFKSNLGVTAGRNGHYEFDSAAGRKKRDITPEEPHLSYTADVKRNVYSLDLEESIDSLECSANSLTLHLTSKHAVHGWGREFYVSGGEEWGCPEGIILRRVAGVRWLGADDNGLAVAQFATTQAQYTDVFDRAHISIQQLIPDVTRELHVVSKGPKPAAKRSSDEFPTLGNSISSYYDEFPMDPENDEDSDSAGDSDLFGSTKLIINSPVEYDAIFNEDYLNITWTYNKALATTDYWVAELRSTSGYVAYSSGRLDPGVRSRIVPLNTTLSGSNFNVYVTLYNKKNKVSKSATRGPYYVNYSPEFMLLTPEGTDVFQSGDLMNITWEYTEGVASKSIQLQLCTYSDGTVSCKKKATVTASRGEYTQKCDNNMKADGEYFWRIKYSGGCVNGRIFTFYYTHNIKERLYIEEPSVGADYKSGDIIEMRWAHQDFTAGELVRIQLCKQRWGFNKCYKDYGYVDVTLGGANLIIPDGLGDSTLYYLSIRYHRSSKRWHRAESKRFAINHESKVHFTSPSWGDIIEPGRITTTWTTELPEAQEVYVTLRKKLPVVFDPFYLFHSSHSTAVKVAAGVGTYSFDVDEGFYTPAYFTIRYNCLFGKHLCHEETSPLFTVPDVKQSGWNYNKNTGGAAVNPFPLYSYSCEDCKKENTSNIFCDVCNKWHEELDFVSECKDCYAAAEFVMYDLTLDIELGAVIACTFNLNASTVFNVGSFHNKITSEYQKEMDLHLLTVPINGIPFKVAGVNIGTGFTLDVDMDTLFKYDSAVALDAGFSRKADLWGRLEYGTTTRNGIFVGAHNYEGSTPTGLAVSGTATASAAIGFKVSVNAALSLICSLSVWAKPVFTPSLSFSYPAFDAKSTSGACASKHYAEYAVDFDFYHGGEGKVVFPKKVYSNQSHDISLRFIDGCFLPAKTTPPTLTLSLKSQLVSIFPADTLKSAISAITHEAAAAIGVDPATIYVPEDFSSTMIAFNFMNEDSAAAESARAALKAAVDDPSNELWTMSAFQTIQPYFISSN